MFVADASSLVAIILPEDDGEIFASKIDAAGEAITHSIAVYECVLALVRVRRMPVAQATLIVRAYLERAGIRLVAIDPDAHVLALEAHSRYGKGTGHPAELNMGDCFIYAVAKTHGASLLYKGDDFAQTDLA